MADEPPRRDREPVFRNIIQAGQLMQVVPMLGVLGLLIKLVFIAGATYTAFTTGLEAERIARVTGVAEVQHEAHEVEARLSAKIDVNAKLGEQQMNNLANKIVDMKESVSEMRNTMAEIARASTPTRR